MGTVRNRTPSDHPDAVRSRNRRAYQRWWRNMRNYRDAVDQMSELDERADRSLNLALDAYNEMRQA